MVQKRIKKLRWIIVTASISVVGLIVLQGYWTKSALGIKAEQVNQELATIVDEASNLYERIKIAQYIERIEDDTLFFNSVVGTTQKALRARNEQKYNGQFKINNPIQTEIYEYLQRNNIDTSYIKDQNASLSDLDLSDGQKNYIYLAITERLSYLNQVMYTMYDYNQSIDIKQRIDIPLLDSLLRKEFDAAGISGSFSFSLIFKNNPNKVLQLATSNKHYDSSISEYDVTTPFLPNQISDSGLMLALKHHKKDMLIVKSSNGAILLSTFFLIIIIASFYYVLRLIFKQKKISEIRKDFISNMSHELKTPISTINLATQAIKDPDLDHINRRHFIDVIQQENKRLEAMVNNVLKTSLLNEGAMTMKKRDLNVNQIVKNIVKNNQIRVTNLGGSITYEIPQNEVYFNADDIHFTNIINNLVDNAVKYANGAPHIKIIITEDKNGLILQVEDNGIGIQKAEQKKIFDNLYRVPTGNIHNVKGFGLGLSYVKKIVELHEGVVEVDSELNHGSTFSLKFNRG